jgi:hypothetical protein
MIRTCTVWSHSVAQAYGSRRSNVSLAGQGYAVGLFQCAPASIAAAAASLLILLVRVAFPDAISQGSGAKSKFRPCPLVREWRGGPRQPLPRHSFAGAIRHFITVARNSPG